MAGTVMVVAIVVVTRGGAMVPGVITKRAGEEEEVVAVEVVTMQSPSEVATTRDLPPHYHAVSLGSGTSYGLLL